jgi:hypothetical protein
MADESQEQRLNWGETPWDNLSREELLRESQKMYAALEAADTVIDQTRHNRLSPHLSDNDLQAGPEKIREAIDRLAAEDGYWGAGAGGRAREMVRQAMSRAAGYHREEVSQCFFRYAIDLLFKEPEGLPIGSGWAICPSCGRMLGRDGFGETSAGRQCSEVYPGACDGEFRLLSWDDLQPQDNQADESSG